MPEGPELKLASIFVNRVMGHVGKGLTGGKAAHAAGGAGSGTSGRAKTGRAKGAAQRLVVDVTISEGHKSGPVALPSPPCTLEAMSRGKELMLTLASQAKRGADKLHLLLRFGMSGQFVLQRADGDGEGPGGLRKHSHLNFHLDDGNVLSFVDMRKFGSWRVVDDADSWEPSRSPCILGEYHAWRRALLQRYRAESERKSGICSRPLCESMFEQELWNGVGNYLRAEALYVAGVAPFSRPMSVLDALADEDAGWRGDGTDSRDGIDGDILRAVNLLGWEVVNLEGGGYAVLGGKDHSAFEDWLQVYFKDGAYKAKDGKGRTMWWRGEAGPLFRGSKSKHVVKPAAVKKEASVEKPVKKARSQASGVTKRSTRASVKTEPADEEAYRLMHSKRSKR